MKQCVKFPEDKFLAVRTCLVAICLGNRPAANLLSILLFRYNLRMENKDDAENQNAVKASKGETPDQDTSVRIFRTQAQLVEDMCGEMTEKTLHDTAVPMLQLLGFLDLEEHMIANCYILHVDLVQQALNLYLPGKQEQSQLEKFLISTMTPQLEKFLIDLQGLQLEEVLIDKKFFLSGLEKVLIQNRKTSNYKRGRKTGTEAVRRAKSQPPKNIEEYSKKNIEEESVFTDVHTAHAPIDNENHSHAEEENDLEETKRRIPVVKPPSKQQATPADFKAIPSSKQTLPPVEPDGPATDGIGSEPGASGDKPVTQAKPKRQRKQPAPVQLSLHEQEIKTWYEELRGMEVSFSKRNVAALQALGKRTMSKDDFLNVVAILDGDKWFEEHKIGVDLYWIERQWDNKIIFLRNHKKPLADTAKPPPEPSEFGHSDFDIYVGNGPEERRAVYEEGLRRLAEGTLLE